MMRMHEDAPVGISRFGWRTLAGCVTLLPAVLALAGCISSSSPSPPANTTVVVPNGSTVVCQDGGAPPCR